MGPMSITAPVLAELPELLVAGSMLEAVTAFGRRVQVRVESVDGAGVDVACPDGALVPGMPVTVRVATGGGVAFVQLGVERIESTGAWAHARLRASAVLSVDGERRFSRCRYAGTVWLGGRRSGAAEGEVVDLSAVGIRFRTASRLDPDDELELALEVPGSSRSPCAPRFCACARSTTAATRSLPRSPHSRATTGRGSSACSLRS